MPVRRILGVAGVTFVSALLAGAVTTGAWNLLVHETFRVDWTTAFWLAGLLAAIVASRDALAARSRPPCPPRRARG
jgi:hypothetical protein